VADINQRTHFRLEYPASERPHLVVDKTRHPVLDISENGLKFLCTGTFKPRAGASIRGVIKFKNGGECAVEGKVLRYAGDGGCVVLLVQGIPLSRMMEEHRLILQKYPA
jgi:hypothetical protein